MGARLTAVAYSENMVPHTYGVTGRMFLGIVGDCDCHEPKMLVIAREIDRAQHHDVPEGACVVVYLSRRHAEDRRWSKGWLAWEITPLRDFGVAAELFDAFLDGTKLVCTQHRPSVAKYLDGQPRRWQAYENAETLIREDLADLVRLAIAHDEDVPVTFSEVANRG